MIVPFFGDQPFWAHQVHQRGAGPAPLPWRQLTATHPSLEQRLEQLAKVGTELGRPLDGGFTSGQGF